MHGFDQPQVGWQDSPRDILLERTAEALNNTLDFFYELLYKQPVDFQGIKSPLHVIKFGAMCYQREDQAKRIILCLLILFLVQANLWFYFRFVRFFIRKIWVMMCFLWALWKWYLAYCDSTIRSFSAIFSPSSENEANKERVIAVNESRKI
ncbi:MAG: hypothetical protein LQ339_008284 [Xanthoria mediterranea]|nr:MAG: hypothetical protein LQ339_008284 [Xanthoria mediterranea]